MLRWMGFLDSLRKAIAGPPRVHGEAGEAAEVDATFHEEYSARDVRGDESREIEEISGAPAAPIAAAPFAGSGESRAAEIEDPLLAEEGQSEPDEDPVSPDL